MQFRDLKKQYQVLKEDMDKAMLEAVASGAYIMGPQVKESEKQLAEYVGVKHCLTCANGTDALTLALKAWGIGPGDAVFVPDFTFFSSAEVVPLEGAEPVFVDVCEETFNLDAADLERAVQAVLAEGRLRPRVAVAVDLFGLPADYKAIRAVADKYGLLILEDGAQGFGGSIQMADQVGHDDNVIPGLSSSVIPGLSSSVIPGSSSVIPSEAKESKRACSFGDIATTSFFPAKPVGCYGDGGAVFTDNDEWAALIESYRVHGKGQFKYDNVRIGMNSRLDTVQAAVLQVKLKAFDEYELADINLAALQYTKRLKDIVATPVIPEGFLSSWAQYTIRLRDKAQRDALQAALKAEGIPSMVYYPKPMHLQTAFADSFAALGMTKECHSEEVEFCHSEEVEDRRRNLCPVATSLCDRVLSLPMHPYLTTEQIDLVCDVIRKNL